MARKLTKKVEQLIARERVCRVATVGDGVMPHCVPVCHVVSGGKIYFGSGSGATKVRHLESNPNVAVTVDLYSDDWAHLRGVMVQGTATVIERGPRFARARDLLYAKYPQYRSEAALSPSDSVVIEVTPSHVFRWGLG
jgi:nitroimidazol reductase NimA-like FMN-containing flavoprotein (pyridoxamine 5'-phosphate oxidase superfamily)